jgi:hypothetical protein
MNENSRIEHPPEIVNQNQQFPARKSKIQSFSFKIMRGASSTNRIPFKAKTKKSKSDNKTLHRQNGIILQPRD